MDIYVLDSDFEPLDILEEFESFVWSERYNSFGDVKLNLSPSKEKLSLLRTGRYLSIPESDRLMVIDSIIRSDSDIESLDVEGRSLEYFFNSRVLPTDEDLSGTVGSIATNLVNKICVQGTGISPKDVIPELVTQNPDSTSQISDTDTKDRNLYSTLVSLCQSDDVGFRVTFNSQNKRLYFKVYRGIDRTRGQNIVSPVVIGREFDNLSKTTMLLSDREYKNVAYVHAKWTERIDDPNNPSGYDSQVEKELFEEVYADGVPSSIQGIDRRVMWLDASGLEGPTSSKLQRAGREALANQKKVELLEGESDSNQTFIYGRDFFLGDIIDINDSYGYVSSARVSEHIWTYDSSGFKSYPTLSSID